MGTNEKRHTQITVLFLHDKDSTPIGQTVVPIDQLPASFEARTNLEIADAHWEVTRAEPATAAEFGRTGLLRLWLRKVVIEEIDPRTILFSLPTICDTLPAIVEGSSKLGRSVLEIAEDDWRQVELVSRSLAEVVTTELRAIERIFAERRTENGTFHEIHLRKQPARSIPAGVVGSRQLVEFLQQGFKPYDGLGFWGIAGLVQDAFAWRSAGGLTLFGRMSAQDVSEICLPLTQPPPTAELDIRALARFAARHDLMLVDWCRVSVAQPDEDEFIRLLG